MLPTLWFRNTWSWGDGARAPAASSATARRSSWPTTRSPATGSRRRPAPTARAPEALFCENETNAPRVFGVGARRRRTRRTGSTTTSSRGAATVNPDGVRHEGRAALPRHGAGRRQGRAAAAAAPAGRDDDRPRRLGGRAVRRRSSPRARPTPTSSTRALAPAGTDAEHDADPAPGVRRARLEQADVPVQRAPLARRRPGRAAAARGAPPRPQQRLAAPRLVRRARDAGPVGVPVVRGLGPRLPRDRRGRTSTRRSRSTSCVVLLREWFQHPNGALPAYEWNFDDVNPPVHVMAALRVFVIDGGARPRVPRAGLPEAADQLHVVAQPRGRRRQQRLQRRLPRASTTSARSTARTCPRASRSSRPTARRGWPTTRSSMLVIAIELAEENDVYLRHGDQVPRAVRPRSRGRSSGRVSTTPRTGSSTTGSSTRRASRRQVKVQTISGLIPRAPRRRPAGRAPSSRRQARQAVRAPPRRAGRRRAGALVGRVRELGGRADACSSR